MTELDLLAAYRRLSDSERAAVDLLFAGLVARELVAQARDVLGALESPIDDEPRKSPSGDMSAQHTADEAYCDAYLEPIRLGAKRTHEQPGGRRVAMCRIDDCTSTVRSRGLCRRHGG
jgi:hypothetical protein